MSSKRAQGRRAQQARRDATHAALIGAARQVFADRGFAASTLDDVARAAGLTKGALYYAFDSKEDLFLALQEERFDAQASEVGAVRVALGEHSTLGAAAAAGLPLDREWNQLFLEFVTYASRHASFRASLLARIAARRDVHAQTLQQIADATGRRLTIAPERLAHLMSALANGLALDALIDPDTDAQALLGEGFDALWTFATHPTRPPVHGPGSPPG